MRVLVWGLLLVVAGSAPAEQADVRDTKAFAGELRRIGQRLETLPAAAVREQLPEAWRVVTPEGEMVVSSKPLRVLLERAATRGPAQQWLADAAAEVDSYAKTGGQAGAKIALRKILARPEFAGEGPPSAWELFWKRVGQWVAEWLERVLRLTGQHPTAGWLIFWIAAAGAVGWIAFWLVKAWGREGQEVRWAVGPEGMAARSSDDWRRAAREAASAGDWRMAMRCGYWAGVGGLQEAGRLPREKARTPREYVQAATEEGVRGGLAGLTRQLEWHWYGRRAATVEEYAASVRGWEALGCRMD